MSANTLLTPLQIHRGKDAVRTIEALPPETILLHFRPDGALDCATTRQQIAIDQLQPHREACAVSFPPLLQSQHFTQALSEDQFYCQAHFRLHTQIELPQLLIAYPRLFAGLLFPRDQSVTSLQEQIGQKIHDCIYEPLSKIITANPFTHLSQAPESEFQNVLQEHLRLQADKYHLLPDLHGCLAHWSLVSEHYEQARLQHLQDTEAAARRARELAEEQEQWAARLEQRRAEEELAHFTNLKKAELQKANQLAELESRHLSNQDARDEERHRAELDKLREESETIRQQRLASEALVSSLQDHLKETSAQTQSCLADLRLYLDAHQARLHDHLEAIENTHAVTEARAWLSTYHSFDPDPHHPGLLQVKTPELRERDQMRCRELFQLHVRSEDQGTYAYLLGIGPEKKNARIIYRLESYLGNEGRDSIGYHAHATAPTNHIPPHSELTFPECWNIPLPQGAIWQLNDTPGVEFLFLILTAKPIPDTLFDELRTTLEHSPVNTRGPVNLSDLVETSSPGAVVPLETSLQSSIQQFGNQLSQALKPHQATLQRYRITHLQG